MSDPNDPNNPKTETPPQEGVLPFRKPDPREMFGRILSSLKNRGCAFEDESEDELPCLTDLVDQHLDCLLKIQYYCSNLKKDASSLNLEKQAERLKVAEEVQDSLLRNLQELVEELVPLEDAGEEGEE